MELIWNYSYNIILGVTRDYLFLLPTTSLHSLVLTRTYSAHHPSRNKENQRWNQLGIRKPFRRLHSDAGASDRLESLNIFPSLQEAARSHLLFDWVASSLYLGGLEDPAHCSIMESSRADAASLQVNPFHCQIFLNDLRFDQLYAFMSLFSLKSHFLSNDLGCGNFW